MTICLESAQKIIRTGISLLEKGLVLGTGGNVSCRTDEGVIITPSGMDYLALVPEDLVLLGEDGSVLEGKRKPSVEKDLHLNIYRRRKDVDAVIHTHSVWATALAAARKPLIPVTDNHAVFFGGAVPVAEYAPIGSLELAENAVRSLKGGSAVLLANHGAVCVGADLSETLLKSEMLEMFSKIFILSEIVGGALPLTDEQVKDERDDLKERYGQ